MQYNANQVVCLEGPGDAGIPGPRLASKLTGLKPPTGLVGIVG